ncbi:hypothetical protein [Christiangramia crocea]|uniref:Uncharacterized protein n=1 Tax=Christiangramia crocea TaxID=2904124 RepID=A0A9X1UUK0_9FLAO|nr:hypothetical protein [Gramella crocea]MCG9970520.1 hypothetical protein [Gramella crocea]
MGKWTLILSFFLFNIPVIQSQIIDKYSISGKGTMDIFTDSFFEGIDLNIFSRSYIYTIGYYDGEEYFNDFLFPDSPEEKFYQFNLLFGKYIDLQRQNFRIRYQAGIGRFWGTLRTDELDPEFGDFNVSHYLSEEFSTIGFPVKIGGRYIPFNFLSIGVDIQANLNAERVIIRPMLCLDIGKLKD